MFVTQVNPNPFFNKNLFVLCILCSLLSGQMPSGRSDITYSITNDRFIAESFSIIPVPAANRNLDFLFLLCFTLHFRTPRAMMNNQ